MKKIIWVFGEYAICKKTLIEYLLKRSTSDIAVQLRLENEKINIVENTLLNNLASFDDESNEQRLVCF